jgi:hypothetical protein
MEVDEGDEACAMQLCSDSDSSSDFLVGPLLKDLDSISFREALKKAHAEHGLF